jgi:hypothetical protein
VIPAKPPRRTRLGRSARQWWDRDGCFLTCVLIVVIVWTAVIVSLFVPEPFWEREGTPQRARDRTYIFLASSPFLYGMCLWGLLRWAERFTPGYKRRAAARHERAALKRKEVEETVDRLFPGG